MPIPPLGREPAWAVFNRAQSWRQAQWQAVLVGVAGYGLAFVAALVADQPFGPVCVVGVLGVGFLMRWVGAKR